MVQVVSDLPWGSRSKCGCTRCRPCTRGGEGLYTLGVDVEAPSGPNLVLDDHDPPQSRRWGPTKVSDLGPEGGSPCTCRSGTLDPPSTPSDVPGTTRKFWSPVYGSCRGPIVVGGVPEHYDKDARTLGRKGFGEEGTRR